MTASPTLQPQGEHNGSLTIDLWMSALQLRGSPHPPFRAYRAFRAFFPRAAVPPLFFAINRKSHRLRPERSGACSFPPPPEFSRRLFSPTVAMHKGSSTLDGIASPSNR